MSRLDILKQDNDIVLTADYKSKFDFEECEIEDEDVIEEISKKEEEIIRTGKLIAKKTLEFGKTLYAVQQILSNYKTGSFVAWYTYMGLEKNIVYREINRWELFQKHRNPQIAEASIRTLEFLKKNELEAETVEEILEKPKEAAELIKTISKENEESEDAETELKKIEKKIERLEGQLKKLQEKKIRILKGE